jgi:hypothetical protein
MRASVHSNPLAVGQVKRKSPLTRFPLLDLLRVCVGSIAWASVSCFDLMMIVEDSDDICEVEAMNGQ